MKLSGFLTLALLTGAHIAFAAGAANNQSGPPPLDPPSAASEGRYSRWLDLDTLSFSMRYRDYKDTDGFKLFDYGQERSAIGGRFKLDTEGKYSINFGISSGRYFGWAYSDVIGGSYGGVINQSTQHYVQFRADEVAESKASDPVGTDFVLNRLRSGGWALSARRLYLSAKPIKQLAFEYGSLGIERGAGSEITSYDEDGYVTGERLRIRDPHHLFVDELTVTYGYLGDFFTPNFFARGDRLAKANYHQFMASKKLGNRLKASVDYTWDKGTHTMREAVYGSVRESRVIDTVRVEFYQRTNEVTFQDFTFDPGTGVAFTAGKRLHKSWQLDGGYAFVDHDYTVYGGSQALDAVNIALNGDAYGTGRRFFGRVNYKLNPYVSFFGFYTHAVDTFWNSGKEGFNSGLQLEFKKLITSKPK